MSARLRASMRGEAAGWSISSVRSVRLRSTTQLPHQPITRRHQAVAALLHGNYPPGGLRPGSRAQTLPEAAGQHVNVVVADRSTVLRPDQPRNLRSPPHFTGPLGEQCRNANSLGARDSGWPRTKASCWRWSRKTGAAATLSLSPGTRNVALGSWNCSSLDPRRSVSPSRSGRASSVLRRWPFTNVPLLLPMSRTA